MTFGILIIGAPRSPVYKGEMENALEGSHIFVLSAALSPPPKYGELIRPGMPALSPSVPVANDATAYRQPESVTP